jgi:oligopeptidase A
MAETADNPLFLAAKALPRFDLIRPEHVEPAIRELVTRLHADLDALEAAITPTWEGLPARMQALTEPLVAAWGVVGHLLNVANSEALRTAHEAVMPEVIQVYMRIGQSVVIYKGLKEIDREALDPAQQRIIEASVRDAELSGVGLEGEARDRFQAIELELAELATKFSNHLLDATKAWGLTLTSRAEIDGLPPTLLAAAAQAAVRHGSEGATAEQGPWRITLEHAVMGPFLEHSRRRDLREQVYRANVTRASSGELDNQPVLTKILALRQEKAKLLGFESYAELSLASKMAPGVEAVDKLLGELRAAARPRALGELEELTEYARAHGQDEPLAVWDIGFWAERLREERYAYTDEELRPYFPMPRVLDGLFATAHRLFGVTVRAADGEVPVWHESVRFFRVADEAGRDLAAFYLDPFSRPETKRGGAWMDNAVDRQRRFDGTVRNPVAYLVCNGTLPVGDRPSLMTFGEVETLFHEFGHGLQHMLTVIDYPGAAGINNVEWDAVELPSQFMENWCFHRPTLLGMARHVDTGAPLPDELFDKITRARTYRAGSMTLRQVYFATLDLELHRRAVDDARAVQEAVAVQNTVIPPLPEDRFLCGFSHIFAGGYAAGYYSYKWAEVLSADAFAAFEEAGLDEPAAVEATGRRFRETVLALGGARHPLEVFRAFRGREPEVAALLRHTGLSG